MAYNTKSIIKDVNQKPVPQYYNPALDKYEVVTSKDGMLRVIMVGNDGNAIQSQNLIDQINNKIDELIQVVNQIGI